MIDPGFSLDPARRRKPIALDDTREPAPNFFQILGNFLRLFERVVVSEALELDLFHELGLAFLDKFVVFLIPQGPKRVDDLGLISRAQLRNLHAERFPTVFDNLAVHAVQGCRQRLGMRHETDALLEIQGAETLQVTPADVETHFLR